MKYFDHWDDIPLEVYQITLAEVKENFDDILAEVVSTTDKSIRLLLAFGIFIVSAATFIMEKQRYYLIEIPLYGLSVLNIILIYIVIRGRMSYNKGLEVGNMLSIDFIGRRLTIYEKQQVLYKNAIKKYQFKIDGMVAKNQLRAMEYNYNLGMSIALIIVISTYCALL